MLDALLSACNHGGKLLGVSRTLFHNDPRFVTTVSFRFESLTLGFRADSDLDTLDATIGQLTKDDNDVVSEVGSSAPWSACVGRGLRWGWRLTNQQGYTDGVRLEFGDPDSSDEVVVELLVVASAIQVFVSEVRVPPPAA
jgi:hypothetical protein